MSATISTDWSSFSSIEWTTHEDSAALAGMKSGKGTSCSVLFERQKDDPSSSSEVMIGDKHAFGKGTKVDHGELHGIDNSCPALCLVRLLENKAREITNASYALSKT